MKELWEKLLKYIRKLTPAIKRAFLLPPGVILVLFPATMVLCIIALNNRGLFPAMEYTIYLISAYSLAVLIVGMSDVSKLVMRRLHGSRWAQSNPIASLFISDFRFRGELSLYQGLMMSTLFAVFKGAAAIFYQSQWFAAVAGYYIIFGISRLLLVRSWRKSQKLSGERRRIRELKGYRQCGCLMFLLNVGIQVMVVQLIREEHTIAYPGSIIYITAAYTFYILTLSIVNIVKFRRLNKIGEGCETILDKILSGTVDLVVDTPSKSMDDNTDGYHIRRTAVEARIPCLTSLDTANAYVSCVESQGKQPATIIDIAQI